MPNRLSDVDGIADARSLSLPLHRLQSRFSKQSWYSFVNAIEDALNRSPIGAGSMRVPRSCSGSVPKDASENCFPHGRSESDSSVWPLAELQSICVLSANLTLKKQKKDGEYLEDRLSVSNAGIRIRFQATAGG